MEGGQWDCLQSISNWPPPSLLNMWPRQSWVSKTIWYCVAVNVLVRFPASCELGWWNWLWICKCLSNAIVLTDKSKARVLWHDYAQGFDNIKGWYVNVVTGKPGTASIEKGEFRIFFTPTTAPFHKTKFLLSLVLWKADFLNDSVFLDQFLARIFRYFQQCTCNGWSFGVLNCLTSEVLKVWFNLFKTVAKCRYIYLFCGKLFLVPFFLKLCFDIFRKISGDLLYFT